MLLPKLTSEQSQILEEMLAFCFSQHSKFLVLEGFSGTGKSTLLAHLEKEIGDYFYLRNRVSGRKILPELIFTASTNQAAEELSLKVHTDVKTYHSQFSLRLKNDFRTGETTVKLTTGSQPLILGQIAIIDEAFFLGPSDINTIMQILVGDGKIIFTGDPDQLLARGLLESPINKEKLQTITLTKNMRNPGAIEETGHLFRKALHGAKKPNLADIPQSPNIEIVDGQQFKQMIDSAMPIARIHPRTAKIMTWTNKKALAYNDYVRGLFTQSPHYEPEEYVISNSITYQIEANGNKKPVLTNNQMLKVKSCSEVNLKIKHIAKKIDCYAYLLENNVTVYQFKNKEEFFFYVNAAKQHKNWAAYFYLNEYLADLRPVFSSTTHKAQGSTYEIAFVDADEFANNNNYEEFLRLMYVACTRPTHKLVLKVSSHNRYIK